MTDTLDNNNPQQDIKSGPFGVKYGVITSLAVIIYGLILNLTGLSMNQALGYVNYLIMGVIMYLACKAYKEANNDFMSYGKAFGLGMIISSITAVISGIFTYLYMAYIDDSIMQLVKDKQLEELEKQGLTDAQIEQALDMSEMFMTPGVISIFAIVGMVFFGAIISLIVAAIVKNPRPEFQ